MNGHYHFYYSIPAKVAAAALFVVLVLGFLLGAAAAVAMNELGFYNSLQTPEQLQEDLVGQLTQQYADQAFYDYYFFLMLSQARPEASYYLYEADRCGQKFDPAATNFLFTLENADGVQLLSTYDRQPYSWRTVYTYDGSYHADQLADALGITPSDRWEEIVSVAAGGGDALLTASPTYYLTAYVRDPLTAWDWYYTGRLLFEAAYPQRFSILWATAGCGIGAVLAFLLLMCGAGRRARCEGICLNGADRIPLDLLAAMLALAAMPFGAMPFVVQSAGRAEYTLLAAGIGAVALLLLGLEGCLTLAARYKAGRWWENTVLWRVGRLLCRAAGQAGSLLGEAVQGFSLAGRALGLLGVLTVLELMWWDAGLLVLERVALSLVLGAVFLQLQRLQQGGEKLAAGQLDYQVDTARMLPALRRHGEQLNRIREGMRLAVQQQLRSERLKTELITNVSHDIKTPLTSIVNYVDLLKKEPVASEAAASYLQVLERQCARLKKLIEDLVEASKASTGNITVNAAPTDVGELLSQAAGEYQERLLAGGLPLVVQKPEEPVYILADGRLLWRIFDNLLGNICKYSQPDTRVYLTLEEAGQQVLITFRNISRFPLNISSDELMERFVRGDSARSTEGSGLGLSIAKSLAELQGGSLSLLVDGDLFKAVLTFGRWQAASPAGQPAGGSPTAAQAGPPTPPDAGWRQALRRWRGQLIGWAREVFPSPAGRAPATPQPSEPSPAGVAGCSQQPPEAPEEEGPKKAPPHP